MTIKYYTQSQIDQQASVIGQRLRGITSDLTEYIDASVMSTEERQKLASLESSKFLGTFLTSDDIPLDKAVAGSYADVDAGPGETVSRWIYDADNEAFVKSTGEVAGETSVSVKEKYESNPNTNAFTDTYKATVEALAGLAPATSIESFLEAFNAAMSGVALGTVMIDLSTITNESTPGYWESSFYSNDADFGNDYAGAIEIYANQIVEEINNTYTDFNLQRSEIDVVLDSQTGRYSVTPAANADRISGTLDVVFLTPL